MSFIGGLFRKEPSSFPFDEPLSVDRLERLEEGFQVATEEEVKGEQGHAPATGPIHISIDSEHTEPRQTRPTPPCHTTPAHSVPGHPTPHQTFSTQAPTPHQTTQRGLPIPATMVKPTLFLSDRHRPQHYTPPVAKHPRLAVGTEHVNPHPSETEPRIPCSRNYAVHCKMKRDHVQTTGVGCEEKHEMVGVNRRGNIEVTQIHGRDLVRKEFPWSRIPPLSHPEVGGTE